MLNKTVRAVLTVSALIGASAAFAGNANPLHPGYQTFAAKIEFAPSQGSVQTIISPLQPNFYLWNVATAANTGSVQIVMNNPLQPNYKRS